MQQQLVINENQRQTEFIFHIQYSIHGVISIKYIRQNEVHAIKYLLQCSMSSVYCHKNRLLRNMEILLLKPTIQR